MECKGSQSLLAAEMMTLRHAGIPGEMIESCEAGWNESFDKLAESLKAEKSTAQEPMAGRVLREKGQAETIK